MREFARYLTRTLTRRTALVAIVAVAAAFFINNGEARAQSATAKVGTAAGTRAIATLTAQPPSLSAQQLGLAQAGLAKSHRSGPISLPMAALASRGPVGSASDPIGSAASANPNLPTDIYSNTKTVAPSGSLFSAVGEPSGDNSGHLRFHTGNWYATVSQNQGISWSFVDPFSLFGSGFCCDQVVVYDPGRNTYFWLLQYTDGHLVLANSRDLVNWCSYTITPGSYGLTGELDYNDMAISTDFVFITSNFFPSSGGSGTVVARWNIDQMVSCAFTNFNFFSATDSFTWKLVQSATTSDIMYWGTNWLGTLGSSFRVFSWADNSGSIFWQDSTLGTTFAFESRNSGQNCGSQDAVVTNWCQFADSRVLGGATWRDPGTNNDEFLVFSWNAKQGGPFNLPFPYTERAYFRKDDKAYVSSDRIFNNTLAFQFTSMASDIRGHIGMTSIFGGGTGTTHRWPSGFVILQDDVSPYQAWQGFTNNNGSGNACVDSGLGRYGDYMTVRPYRPTNIGWLAYNYALIANAGGCGFTASVRVLETGFGRVRDAPGAFLRWQN